MKDYSEMSETKIYGNIEFGQSTNEGKVDYEGVYQKLRKIGKK